MRTDNSRQDEDWDQTMENQLKARHDLLTWIGTLRIAFELVESGLDLTSETGRPVLEDAKKALMALEESVVKK